MADAEVKEYPGFPRLVLRDSLPLGRGHDILATQFALDLAEAIKKVPEEHHPRTGISYPDEWGDEWSLDWWFYESDEAYEKRYIAHKAAKTRTEREARREYANAAAAVNVAKTVEEKRSAVAGLNRAEYRLKELRIEP